MTLQFTDDKEDMEFMLWKLIKEYNKWQLKVNLGKIRHLYVRKRQKNLQLQNKEIGI